MQYTVSSRGRPIGTTDLGFRRIGGPFRSGWFHPNAEGERLMPVIAGVSPALRACVHRDALGEHGGAPVQEELAGSTPLADLAQALQRVEALDLALHREDGSIVPTEMVGIQDTEQLLAWADLARTEAELSDGAGDVEGWPFDDPFDDSFNEPGDGPPENTVEIPDDAVGGPMDDALGHAFGPDTDPEAMFEDGMAEGVHSWTPDDEPTVFPRYQIHVVLADPKAIP